MCDGGVGPLRCGQRVRVSTRSASLSGCCGKAPRTRGLGDLLSFVGLHVRDPPAEVPGTGGRPPPPPHGPSQT